MTNFRHQMGVFTPRFAALDSARHAEKSQGLNVSLLSMAKMLTVHLIRHHCICTAQKLHLWASRARSQSPHRHAHCEFRTVTNIFYNPARQWDARKGPRF